LGAVTSNACAEGHRYALVIALLNCSVFRARHREATQSPSSHDRQPILDNDPKGQEVRKWENLLKEVEERRDNGEFSMNILDDPRFAAYDPAQATLKDGAALKQYLQKAMGFYNTIASNYSRSGQGTSGEESYNETFAELNRSEEIEHSSSSSSSSASSSSASSSSPSSSPALLLSSPSRSPSPVSSNRNIYSSDQIE
jgi:hypothetical protein